jgi:hypothetical protein
MSITKSGSRRGSCVTIYRTGITLSAELRSM